MKVLLSVLFFIPILLFAEVFRLDSVDFHYRVPEKYNDKSKIMVLFGGRNWKGGKTLRTYDFNDLADKHGVFLLSPSFKDRAYWEPEVWSGRLLQKAIRQLEKRYNLQSQKVYFYGYSAGRPRTFSNQPPLYLPLPGTRRLALVEIFSELRTRIIKRGVGIGKGLV